MTKYLFVLFFFFLFLIKPKAQIDTSFWFVAPEVPTAVSVNSVGLQIGSYNQAATVYVRQPANLSGVNFSLTLPANTSTLINLTGSQALITSTLANGVDNKGLYISSTDLVSINYIIGSSNGKESISLKGTNAVGDDFYTPFPNTINTILTPSVVVSGAPPRNIGFDIVATESGLTTVVITPRGNLIGPRVKNNTFVKTLNQGETFSCIEALKNNRRPRAIVNGSFNGDAFKDVAIVDDLNNLVYIFLGNGSGGFTEVNNYPLGNAPTKILAVDVNGDSNQDLIVTNSGSHNISVFLGAGNGNFGAATNFPAGGVNPTPVSVVCDDIDGDAKLDLIVANYGTNRVGVLKGNGLGSFAASVTYTVGTNPSDVAVMDFDNDGDKDLAVTNYGSNNLSVLTGTTPLGTFATFSVFPVGNNPNALVIANYSSDTNEDIAVACYGSARVGVLRSVPIGTTSALTFTTVVYYATGANPVSIVSTSVNGDAFPDLVTANYGGNSLSTLAGTGSATGTFVAATTASMTTNPYSIAFDDYNGDLLPDFITANYTSIDFGLILGNGTTTLSAVSKYIYGYELPFITDLPGSIVSSDKKIALTLKGAIANASTCPSFFADQITNSSKIGMHHVIHQSNTTNDVAYILATVNSTSLSITSATTTNWLINTGETFTVNSSATSLTYIQSDKPVYVLNLAGNGCKLGGAQIAPAYCAGSYTAGFTRSTSDSLFLQVYIRNGFQSTFTLMINSVPNPISASAFTIVPGSSNNLVGARIYYNTTTIPVGAYCILKNSADLFGFSTQNSSNPGGNSFSQHTSFDSKTFVIANVVPTATICSNTSFTLNGQIGGGPITGNWTSNGFGTLSGPSSQIINNIYTPNPIDTNIKPVKIVLTSTGICPNKSDTIKLTVKQAPLVTAGSGSVICSNNPTVQLNGNVYGTSTVGVWSVQSPGSGTFVPSINSFTPTYLLSTADQALNQLQFVLTSTNNAGCNPVTDMVTVIVNHPPTVVASAVNPILKCANNSTVFLNGTVSGTTTSTGKWTSSGTGIFVPNQLSLICNYIPSGSDLSLGSIWLYLTSTNNLQCKAIKDSVHVFFTQPVTVSTGVDLNSCKNNPIVPLNAVITGTASSTGIWYGGAGTFTASNTALTPTYIANSADVSAGFVILTFSTTNNGICAGVSDQVKITFQDKPTANFTVNTVCLNKTTVFADQSINTSGIGSLNGWQWNMGDANGTSNVQNPIYTYTTAGSYTAQLIVSNTFNCYDTIYRPVTIYALPTASFSVSRACTGSAQLIGFTDLSSISPPASIPSTGYYWDFGGFGFSTSKDTSLVFPSQGLYNITHSVTSNNGCVSTYTQFVNITPRPIAKFLYINNSALSLGANIAFIDSSKSAVTWSWDFGNGQTSNIPSPTTNYLSNGSYTVSLTITDQFGCPSTYTAVIRISNIAAEVTQLIPNMITPNNDGKNDIWRLDFINVFFPEAEIEIYNRWGELLYRSIGYSNAWDGSYKGNPLPVGAYFYTINLHDVNDTKTYKGTVTILK